MKSRTIWQIFLVLVSVGYMFLWVMLPTKIYKNTWTPILTDKLNSTYFREQGVNLLLFSFPLMLLAALGCVYLHLQKKSSFQSGKSFYESLRRPAVVMAPLGIVNAVELTFAAMFVALLIWSLANYLYVSFGHLSNFAGVIAFILSIAIWVTSFDRVRRKMFELFFYTHQLYILYIFFYMFHVGVAYLCMILPGIFLFLIDRYLRFLQSRKRSRLLSSRLLPNGTMELIFAKSPGCSYNPTSILFLHVPSICKLQWHPFTVISNSNLETDKLSVAIKSEGRWTRKLYKQLSSSLDRLEVSTEGPSGPASSHFLNRECLVMISGGSGIAPFISIIREIIYQSTVSNTKVPKVVLVTTFKKTADLTMLDLLLPLFGSPLDLTKLQLQIEAYVTQEHERPLEDGKKQIEAILFKPNPSDSPISDVLGENSWLWIGAIISSSFVMFLLLLGFVTRYQMYPVEKRGENYHYSYKILWDMFLVCACVFIATSAIFLWQKREISADAKQIQNVDLPTPTASPSSWLGVSERELESLPHQSLVQSTNVHFGARPDLKRILFDCKEPDVGVLVCGPKSMRHEVAKICASGLAKNLHFESISFSW